MRAITLPLVGLSFALAAGHVATAENGPAKITWTSVLADAIKTAKENKQPVMVTVVAGPEEDRTVFLKALDDAKVKSLAAKVVCVAAAEGVHAGGTDGQCKLFEGLTCAQHDQAFKDLEKKKLLPGTRRVAQHVFLGARGKQLFKRGFGFEGDEGENSLARRMNLAIHAVNKSDVDAEIAEREKFRMEVLLQRVRDRDPAGRRAASAVLGNSDDSTALKAVQRAAKTTGNHADRASIYEALAIRGNWSALALLTGALADRDNMVRLAAIDAMEKIDMPDAALTLANQARKDKALLPAAMAIKGACYLDPADKKIIGAALKTSAHKRVALRIGACWGMSKMLGNQAVVNRLRRILRTDREATARAAAAWALGVIGEQVDAGLISKQLEKEKNTGERPKEVMAAGIERINGSTRGDYEELIESLLAIEAAQDIMGDGEKGKGKWGKWAGKYGKGKGGKGKGGWGGKR